MLISSAASVNPARPHSCMSLSSLCKAAFFRSLPKESSSVPLWAGLQHIGCVEERACTQVLGDLNAIILILQVEFGGIIRASCMHKPVISTSTASFFWYDYYPRLSSGLCLCDGKAESVNKPCPRVVRKKTDDIGQDYGIGLFLCGLFFSILDYIVG